jgi:hypothetical protein
VKRRGAEIAEEEEWEGEEESDGEEEEEGEEDLGDDSDGADAEEDEEYDPQEEGEAGRGVSSRVTEHKRTGTRAKKLAHSGTCVHRASLHVAGTQFTGKHTVFDADDAFERETGPSGYMLRNRH